ncbi:SDR family NAD(P)-dependent oxidoreductase [Variovorax saccharolyticus]|uniref:SDR family NAD(P)-dependent oxidoreductase n=1 Tax=Variovorax saccharolyticus TaxID=3053516 RepID=UPI002577CCD8|nr:SDR family NAD(P)-dependent oxidoreductase [Variovorax sp. J31P216]MDM0025509.1 SDR family NAD(P)-dependent oxidoreductase [Variovorax sp. J31P216]
MAVEAPAMRTRFASSHVVRRIFLDWSAMTKTFFLTGSARGLGRSIAIAVLDAGHQLVATARKPRQLDDLVERYRDRILPVALDVTDFAAAQGAVRAALDSFGRLDVVINNAGFANVGSVEDMPMSAIVDQMDANFIGSVHVIKAALPVLRQQAGGRIIQVSSIGARIATPGAAAYYASKWALAGFIESLALEVAPLGIKVTALEPGGMKTDFAEDASLTVIPSSAAYAATAGNTAKMMKSAGYADAYAEPSRVAALVMRIAELDEPPLRLLAGSGNHDYAMGADRARAESDAKWKWLSATID